MSYTLKNLVAGQTLTGSSTLYYTTPALTRVKVQAASVTNPTVLPITVNLYIVPIGQSVGAIYTVAAKTIPAGTTRPISDIVNCNLEPEGQIYADGNGLFLNISGAEIVSET